jgi:hypothetical protein
MATEPRWLTRVKDNDASCTALQLDGRVAGVAAVKALALALEDNSHLTSLTVAGHTLKADGARAFADLLASGRNTTLRALSLSSCNMGDEGLCALAKVLEKNNTLISLNCACWTANFRPFSTLERGSGVLTLVAALRRNTTLQDLNLLGRPLGNEGDQSADSVQSVSFALVCAPGLCICDGEMHSYILCFKRLTRITLKEQLN